MEATADSCARELVHNSRNTWSREMFPSGQYREKANDDCSFFVIYAYDNPIMVIMSIVINKDEVHKTRYKTKKFKKNVLRSSWSLSTNRVFSLHKMRTTSLTTFIYGTVKVAYKGAYSCSSKLPLRATGRHLPWDHTVLPATGHKWTHPALTPASKLVLDLPTPEGWKAELI